MTTLDEALLVLADGTTFEGIAVGYRPESGVAAGEVVFNTALAGYQEIVTDPSYAGQIITFTYPHEHFRFFGNPLGHGEKDVVGGKLGDGVMVDPQTGKPYVDHHGHPVEEPMSAPFIFLVLNFVLLFWLVAKYGGRAGKKLAVERHDQIKTALDEAAKLRTQAKDKLAEYESKLKQADSEITKLVEGMRVDAESDKKRILENAERQAATMKRDAESRIAAEIEAARAALMREVSAAATVAAEKLLREQMTPADQSKVIATFIDDVQAVASKEAR